MAKALLAALILMQLNLSLATPSVEACPNDSRLIDNFCKCDPELCTKPSCLYDLKFISEGSNIPGQCCPTYSCENCPNEALIHGQCPCAEGAILNSDNKCKCIDPERVIKDNKCVCDNKFCKLPPICNRNSVLSFTKEDDACCEKAECKVCPSDSYPTTFNVDGIEDKCVCLPCEKKCGDNQTIIVIEKGKNIPGKCCDYFECKNIVDNKTCTIGDKIVEDGYIYENTEAQLCKCQNGILFCSSTNEATENYKSCHSNENLYKHNESWMADSCTNCTCIDGFIKCIAYWCDIIESQVNKSHCQPLINCNKVCRNGYKLNKRGCEICKCNLFNEDDILQKYNITRDDLIEILEKYKFLQKTTKTITTVVTTGNTAIIPDTTTTKASDMASNKNNNNTFIISTKSCEDATLKWIYGIVSLIFVCLIVGLTFFLKNYRKKGSYDPVKLKGAINNYVIKN